ncbi:MAG TPA: M28 family peptidase [Gemmatimonadaceae bacterium]|nr:M28 family peptidase [Gemmatimonadaceae bacterium]
MHRTSLHTLSRAAALIAAFTAPAAAQRATLPLKFDPRPTTAAITPADLMTRLYIFADDSMMGRQAGTVYHDKGTSYIARELARIGVQPAGENGGYFQQIPLVSRALANGTTVTVDGRAFAAGGDFLTRDNGPTARTMQNAAAIYGGVWGGGENTMLPADQASGKVVVITVPRGWQANRGALTQRYLGAAGVAVVSLDSMPAEVRAALSEPAVTLQDEIDQAQQQMPPVPAFFYTSQAMAASFFGAPLASLKVGTTGKALSGAFNYTATPAPGARNVVGIIPGSDPKLRGQYVAIGAHSDHVGTGEAVDHDSLYAFYHVVRPEGADDGEKPAAAEDWPKVRAMLDSLRKTHAARQDSIFNGADDDGSGSMGVLEVAEAFASAPVKPKRSILLVWHVAEELGLFGSAYYTEHPTVPRDSIVAQLNVDMIGRGPKALAPGGGTGDLQIIGSRRLSTELGDIVDAEGKKLNPPLKYDYQYDANGHPGQYYCRSDHYMYARYGIPVAFLSTGGHPEYHEVTDEPEYIDYDGLARVSQLLYNIAERVANLDHRLVVDKPKPDPKGQCVQ